MKIVGLDLSLTSTGVAVAYNTPDGEIGIMNQAIIPGKKDRGFVRIETIRRLIDPWFNGASAVFMEGLSYASHTPTALERAGLWYLVASGLWKRNIPVYALPPTTLKKFITGKGNAEKSMILKEVYKRFGIECETDDEADAVGLAVLGATYFCMRKPDNQAQGESTNKATKVE
jgi:crossover junction endodeoxyribonuclease RuvC